MDKGQSQEKYSKYKSLLDNGIGVIQDKHAGIMHNKIAIIDGSILFTDSLIGVNQWGKETRKTF